MMYFCHTLNPPVHSWLILPNCSSNLNGIGIPGCYEPELICQIGFAHPIHFVWTGDITCDGVSEIVVLSTAGIHILQVNW